MSTATRSTPISWAAAPRAQVVRLAGVTPEELAVALDPLPADAPVVVRYRMPPAAPSVSVIVDDALDRLEVVACDLFPGWLPRRRPRGRFGIWLIGDIMPSIDRFAAFTLPVPRMVKALATDTTHLHVVPPVEYPPLAGKPHPASLAEQTLTALRDLIDDDHADLAGWLLTRKPAHGIAFLRAALGDEAGEQQPIGHGNSGRTGRGSRRRGRDHSPNAIVVDREGDAHFAALEQKEFWLDPGPANVLQFNRILAAAGFRCNVQESGVSCLSELSGKGFTFSAEAFTPQYTDVPANAP